MEKLNSSIKKIQDTQKILYSIIHRREEQKAAYRSLNR